MRAATALFLVQLISFSLPAQEKKIEHNTIDFVTDRLNVFPDDDGNIVLAYQTSKTDVLTYYKTHLLFNSKGQSKLVSLNGDLRFINYCYDAKNFTFIYQDGVAFVKKASSYQLSDISKDGTILSTKALNFKGEDVITSFLSNGKFYLLTVSNEQRVIKLRTIMNSDSIVEATIKISGGWIEALSKVNFEFIDPEIEVPNASIFDGKVILLADNKLQLSYIPRLDFGNAKKINFINLDFNKQELKSTSMESADESFNYYVTKDVIYLLQIGKRQIDLILYSPTDFSKITSHTFIKENIVPVLLQSPFVIDGKIEKFQTEKEHWLEIFRVLKKGDKFINVVKMNGKTRITIGTNFVAVTGGGFSPGLPGVTPTSLGNIPSSGSSISSPMYSTPTISYLYVYLNDNFDLLNEYPAVKGFYDVSDDFVKATKKEKRRSISKYTIYITPLNGYLITTSNKYKLLTCFKWSRESFE
jgi:hypothetical protein